MTTRHEGASGKTVRERQQKLRLSEGAPQCVWMRMYKQFLFLWGRK